VLAAGTAAQGAYAAPLWGIPALAPALRDAYALSLPQTGLVLAAISVGMTVALLPWGMVADAVAGERAVTAAALGGAACALTAAAFADGFAILFAACALAGALGCGAIPGSGRAVMAWFGAGERGLALAIRQTGVTVGSFASAAVLPLVLGVGGLRACFLTLAGFSLAGAVASGAWLRDAGPAGDPAPDRPATPLRDARVWRIAACGMLLFPAQISTAGFAVLFLHDAHGLSAAAGGFVLAAIQLLGGALRIALGRWSDRRRSRVGVLRALSLAIATSIGLLALLAGSATALAVAALIIGGALGQSWNGLLVTAVVEAAGRRGSGRALGVQQTMLAVAGAAAPVAVAGIVGATSWRGGFAFGAAGPAAAHVLFRRSA
jgi:MFS family permease